MSRKEPDKDPNKKGENWPQFLKQMQDPQIQAILNDDPKMRLNRNARRAAERLKPEEAEEEKRKELAERMETLAFRTRKQGEFFRDVFRQVLPKWAYFFAERGNATPARWLGYVWGTQNGNDLEESRNGRLPKMIPTSVSWVARKKWVLFGEPATVAVTMLELENGEKTFDLSRMEDGCKVYENQESCFKFVWE